MTMQFLEEKQKVLEKSDKKLDKISWFMPRVIPADAEKFPIYKTIEPKVKPPIAYRTRQCSCL